MEQSPLLPEQEKGSGRLWLPRIGMLAPRVSWDPSEVGLNDKHLIIEMTMLAMKLLDHDLVAYHAPVNYVMSTVDLAVEEAYVGG